ncbi:hypothetical protein KJ662_03480 [Patescibacteria group bacterium]|nr:hypothetical protein [Patescibacteria group bacterium]MBU1685290.1 hypothetical protein [Patescibacteria group bacterium]MBU1938321.1 hypothetical protein [Patescibacteria group bacterium]
MKNIRKTIGILTGAIIFMSLSSQVLALNRDDAISDYTQELSAAGVGNASDRAEKEVDALIDSMESNQYDVKAAIENLNTQVSALSKTSSRKDYALAAMEIAKDKADFFTGLEADESIRVQEGVAGTLPYVVANNTFIDAHDSANEAIGKVRRIMISPERPGVVPEGDIVTDFLPQIIRQLFRFAWVGVFVALTVSGVMFIISQGDDERLTKAKSMLYFSLIGFAIVALAFAIVKGVTDIDFFRFI